MSVAQRAKSGGKFVGTIAVYGLGTFLAAGALTALFPDHGSAILVGWLIAAVVGAQLLRRRYLD
jgi:hypothetical protein